jgi:hypothetical protein
MTRSARAAEEPIPADVASIHSRADVAQLVEHFTRNEGVRGSSPRVGSLGKRVSRYLITLDVPDQDAAALEDATSYGDDRVAGIVTGDIDGVPIAAKVQIEVGAPTVTSAGQEAQQIYADLRAHAGLPEIGEQPTVIVPRWRSPT